MDLKAHRRIDATVIDIIRYLGIRQRLSNDLASIAKECASGDHGNAVLLMGRYLDAEMATRFIADQQAAHHRLLTRRLASLPPDDPMATIVDAITIGLEYAQRDLTRYQVSDAISGVA